MNDYYVEARNLGKSSERQLIRQVSELQTEKQQLLDKWLSEADNISEVKMTPTKQNIRITHFGIGWKP